MLPPLCLDPPCFGGSPRAHFCTHLMRLLTFPPRDPPTRRKPSHRALIHMWEGQAGDTPHHASVGFGVTRLQSTGFAYGGSEMGLVEQSQGSSAQLPGQRPSEQERPLSWKCRSRLSNR